MQVELEKAGHLKDNLHSFDAGKIADHVIQCDIANVPLTRGQIDIGVFCLSLMGTNFPDFLREANRVMNIGGTLFIAEVVSRFENINTFSKEYMPKYTGFDLIKSSMLEGFFYIMVFKKADDLYPNSNLNFADFSKQLKPCIYKRR